LECHQPAYFADTQTPPWAQHTHSAEMTQFGKLLTLFYNVVGMAPFGLMSATMVKEVWTHITPETCPRRGSCTETLEFTVAKIYLQVMFGVAMMYSSTLMFPGKKGLLGAMACMCLTMGKHIVIDGLIPPPPVMAMTAGLVAAIMFAPGEWGKRAFVGYCFFNAFTFTTAPLMVLQDTFPDLTEGSEAFKVGKFSFEVISLYMVMSGLVAATPSPSLGLAYSMQVGSTILAKHVIIDKSGPPTPMICLWIVATLASWFEVGFANFDKKTEKAFKDGPMKVHAIIVGTGFVPYFALECIGVSAPVLGLAAVDSSYSYSGSSALFTGMLATFCAITAEAEYTGKMDGKMFAMYHYFLSAVCLFWQFQSTTTTIGALFFAAPHMFTLWSAFLVYTSSSSTKKLKQ
jgi:hypothetical protein